LEEEKAALGADAKMREARKEETTELGEALTFAKEAEVNGSKSERDALHEEAAAVNDVWRAGHGGGGRITERIGKILREAPVAPVEKDDEEEEEEEEEGRGRGMQSRKGRSGKAKAKNGDANNDDDDDDDDDADDADDAAKNDPNTLLDRRCGLDESTLESLGKAEEAIKGEQSTAEGEQKKADDEISRQMAENDEKQEVLTNLQVRGIGWYSRMGGGGRG
jgi:hypothetical protein